MCVVREMVSNIGPIIYQLNGSSELFNLSFHRSSGCSTEDGTEVETTWPLLLKGSAWGCSTYI